MSGISRKLLSGVLEPPREDITFVGSVQDEDTNTFSLTGITGLAEGDLVIVTAQDGSGTFTVTSSGWSSYLPNFPNNQNNVAIRNMVCYKIMGATPDTSIGFSGLPTGLIAAAFRNAQLTPTAATFNSDSSGTASSLDPNALTIASSKSLAVQCAWIDDDSASVLTPSTGFTKAEEVGSSTGTMGLTYQLDVDAGTLDPDTLSWSTSDNLLLRQLVFEANLL